MEKTVNERFKALRTNLSLSQADFCEKTGITQAALSKIEAGKTVPSAKTIRKACEVFNVSTLWLMSGKGEMEAPKETKQNNWLEEAYFQAKERIEEKTKEIEFLRSLLMQKGGANFRKALEYAGVPFGMLSEGTFSGARLGK